MPFMQEQRALMKKYNVKFEWEGDYLFMDFDRGVKTGKNQKCIEFGTIRRIDHTDLMICDDCDTSENVEDTFCPYAEDKHGEKNPCTLCDECVKTRSAEI